MFVIMKCVRSSNKYYVDLWYWGTCEPGDFYKQAQMTHPQIVSRSDTLFVRLKHLHKLCFIYSNQNVALVQERCYSKFSEHNLSDSWAASGVPDKCRIHSHLIQSVEEWKRHPLALHDKSTGSSWCVLRFFFLNTTFKTTVVRCFLLNFNDNI